MFKKKVCKNFVFISLKSAAFIGLNNRKEIELYSNRVFSVNVDFIQQLRDFISKLPPAQTSAVPTCLVLCGDQVTLRTIKTPIVKGGYDEIIYWELVKMFPGKMDGYYWNYKAAGDFVEDSIKKALFKIEIVPRNFIDGILRCLSENNISVKHVISEETAIETIAFINKPDISTEPYTVLNFNSDYAVFNYLENNILKYKRYIENISESISKNAMDFFKINREQLEDYISQIHLIPYSQPEQPDDKYINFSNFIKYQIKIFAEEIIKTENFLRTNYKAATANRIFIFGALSNIAGLDKMLASELKSTSENGRKLEYYRTMSATDKISNITSSVLSYAPLSAQYQGDIEEINIKVSHKNKFIEHSDGVESFITKPVFQLIAIIIIISMVALPFLHSKYYKNRIEAYEKNISEIEKHNAEISASLEKASFAIIDKKFKNIIDAKNYDFYNMYSTIGEVLPAGVSLTSIHINKSDDDPSSYFIMQIEGWSSSPSNIPKFILNIDHTGLFQNINLVNTRRELFKNHSLTRFEIYAVLKEAHLL